MEWKKSYEKQIVYDIANSFKKNKFDIIKQNFELMKLNKSHPQWLGDYDVFAVDINNKSIWIVECKVIEKVATFYDMYRQQNRFFNEHKEDEKFQRRIDYLRENADQVIQQLGCTDYGKESNQETIDAVERLVKSGCTTNIHYVVSKDTINEAITRLEMDSFPKGVNAVIFILYKPVGNGIIEKVLKNTDSRIERFISLATKVKHPYRVGFDTCFTPALLRWGDTVPAVSIDACEAATFSMYIDSQMNCYPCSFGIWDKSISESMNSKTLREIWQGDKFVAFREQRKEKCSSCRQMELCRGGCRLGIDIDMC